MNAGDVDKACKSNVSAARRRVNPPLAELWDRPVGYQLVGRVMAYQGDDG